MEIKGSLPSSGGRVLLLFNIYYVKKSKPCFNRQSAIYFLVLIGNCFSLSPVMATDLCPAPASIQSQETNMAHEQAYGSAAGISPIPNPGQSLLDSQKTWFIAQGPDHPFVLDDNETMVIGERGSSLALFKSRSLALNAGKIVVFAGPEALSIETAISKVTIPALSNAIIDNSVTGLLRIVNLSGDQTHIDITNNASTIKENLNAGEELLISGSKTGKEQRIPVDNVVTQTANTDIWKINKNKVDRSALLDKEPLLVGATKGSLTQKAMNAIRSTLDQNAKKPNNAHPIEPNVPPSRFSSNLNTDHQS